VSSTILKEDSYSECYPLETRRPLLISWGTKI